MPIIKNPGDYDDLREYNPSPHPKPLRSNKEVKNSKAPHYVTESELWEDTMTLYETGVFPERLGKSIIKMVTRAADGWRRFREYDEVVKDDMKSRAIEHVCLKLMEKKFDPNHGSKVYSWIVRVILNEFLQEINKENKRRETLVKYGEVLQEWGQIEVIQDTERLHGTWE